MDAVGRSSPNGSGLADRATIYFEERALFTLRDKGGRVSIRDRSLPAIAALNRLWSRPQPLRLQVHRSAARGARIEASGMPIVEVLPGDAGGADPLVVAHTWAETIRGAFRLSQKPVAPPTEGFP